MPGLQSALGFGLAGARNERVEQNGIAHFLEHMAFKGTQRRTALEIAEADRRCGRLHQRLYLARGHRLLCACWNQDVPLALDVISDIVAQFGF
jgi:predicted Zn-dependent peptidase